MRACEVRACEVMVQPSAQLEDSLPPAESGPLTLRRASGPVPRGPSCRFWSQGASVHGRIIRLVGNPSDSAVPRARIACWPPSAGMAGQPGTGCPGGTRSCCPNPFLIELLLSAKYPERL